MNEDTLVITLRLPDGQDWSWHADLNVVCLSDRLDLAGREAALTGLQWHWRTRFLRVVDSGTLGTQLTSDNIVGAAG